MLLEFDEQLLLVLEHKNISADILIMKVIFDTWISR